MSLNGSTVAVSGSGGFVGRHLVPRLIEAGARVIEISREKGWDIANWEQMKDSPEFDVFVHLAAKSFVPESFAEPRQFYFVNVLGTANALELCRKCRGRFVFASSYVYGNPVRLPVSEEHPLAPLNPYSESKVMAEALCKAYCRDFDVPVTILRSFNIYGPGQDRRFLVPTIIAQARSGRIKLHCGVPRRDFVYVADVVDAYLRAITTGDSDCRIYNIGSGSSVSVSELAERIREKAGCEAVVAFTENVRKGEIVETIADISKARRELGWQPQTNLDEGLELCLADKCPSSL